METQLKYISFNTNKTIDELLYNTKLNLQKLRYLEAELPFLKFLIEANIFKTHVRNLFEILTIFDKKIDTLIIDIKELQNELQIQTNTISNKIDSKNLEQDGLFIKTQDELEFKTHNTLIEATNFKYGVFQYLKSVIKNV